jgi:TIR domain-containing protein
VSYSHRDKEWLERLRIILTPIVRGESVVLWDDTRIVPGAEWREEIERAILGARVAILLVSANFLASEFVFSTELPMLLDQRKAGLTVLWLPISAGLYQYTPLKEIQAAHDPGEPLDTLSFPEQQIALVALAERVKNAMDLNALADVLRVADRFSVLQDAFLQGTIAPAGETLHGVTARQEEEVIRFVDRAGNERTALHAADLTRLDSGSQQLIRTYEKIMADLFDRWTELEPKSYASDSMVRERARAESEQVRRELCQQLAKILGFIEKLNGYLVDHYAHVRWVCGQHSG